MWDTKCPPAGTLYPTSAAGRLPVRALRSAGAGEWPGQLWVPDTAKVQLWAGQYSSPPTVVCGALTIMVPRHGLHAPWVRAPFAAMLSVMVFVSVTVEHLLT